MVATCAMCPRQNAARFLSVFSRDGRRDTKRNLNHCSHMCTSTSSHYHGGRRSSTTLINPGAAAKAAGVQRPTPHAARCFPVCQTGGPQECVHLLVNTHMLTSILHPGANCLSTLVSDRTPPGVALPHHSVELLGTDQPIPIAVSLASTSK